MMEPVVRHVRRYCSEYVARQDIDALDDLLEPDYVVKIAGVEFASQPARIPRHGALLQGLGHDLGLHGRGHRRDRVGVAAVPKRVE